jgi:nickel-dependent lactate racemase
MDIELKYGDHQQLLQIPEKARAFVLRPVKLPVVPDAERAMEEALSHLYDNRESLERLVLGAPPKTVAIAVPDETRPAPVQKLLPVLLGRLYRALPGLHPSEVIVIVGGGLHPPFDSNDLRRLIPETAAPGCRIVSHDPFRSRMCDYGLTSRGTNVRINAEFAEADLKVVIEQIDPHQFVGFTGGAKGVVIGCGAPETIEHNHSLRSHAGARVGVLEGNPVREDLDEAGKMVGIDLAVDVVLDADKNLVRLVAGAPDEVLKQGAETCATVYGIDIRERFDIVVASCGGYPKDICLYQSQKGLNLAFQAVKHGGKILLLAACPQGVGSDIYFDYVCQFATPWEVLEDFQKFECKMETRRAYLFGRTLTDFDVPVAYDLGPGILKKCHLRAADPSVVVGEWVETFEGRPRVAVIPNANTTYFRAKHGSAWPGAGRALSA